jgi:hypothetical protein
VVHNVTKLGSVAGPVIQANGRLSFEDDLRSGGLLTVFHSEPVSGLSLLTVWSLWGNPGMARCRRKSKLSCWIHPGTQSTLGKQMWDLLVSEQSVDFQIKIGRPKFYAGEMITLG